MINTKWPLLLVVGEPVTEEQADEILIRTNGWYYLGSNDRAWTVALEKVAAEFGRPIEPLPARSSVEADTTREDRASYWPRLESWCKKFGILEVEHLQNSRIVSSWIGGPHGWCDWSGRIGCSTYNIGKWPSTEDVTAEWTAIAAAFPYLDLTAQTVEEEGAGRLCGEWRIKDGTVTYVDDPTVQIAAQREIGMGSVFRLLAPGGERGVSLDRLRTALERVAAKADPQIREQLDKETKSHG